MVEQKDLEAVQLNLFPDSRIFSLGEVYEFWLNDFGDLDKFASQYIMSRDCFSEDVEYDVAKAEYVEKRSLEYRLRIATVLALCLQYEAVIFYECGLKEDGSYRWRGARYGIEESAYLSGFGNY